MYQQGPRLELRQFLHRSLVLDGEEARGYGRNRERSMEISLGDPYGCLQNADIKYPYWQPQLKRAVYEHDARDTE